MQEVHGSIHQRKEGKKMKKSFKFFGIAYLILSLVAAAVLGISFFAVTSTPITQLTLLLQSVGFGVVSGLFFGGM